LFSTYCDSIPSRVIPKTW